ncbi:MAG: COX15/CtaA family protein [Bacteroidetes bacterium]|nr:COX15/CtaA family protein [Bacteroidota bacterium]
MTNGETQTHINNRPIIIWLYTGCFLVFAMVIIGGITRLTGSGLSITEWNVVTGTIPPLNEEKWHEEFIKYQQIPQFKKLNSDFTLNDFKNIYWWEYLHRLIGRIMGIAFIVPFLYFLLKKQISRSLLPKLLFIFAWGAWQGFLGWYMVKSGLVHNTHVSHYRLAIHLTNAFITFGYIYWVTLGLKSGASGIRNNASAGVKKLSLITFIILIIQIVYGAFVAGTHAGFMYNTWPKMGDTWIAPNIGDAYRTNGLISLVDNPLSVQFLHRTIALIVLTLITYLWFNRNNKTWNLNHTQIRAINISMFFILTQVLLGIFTLLLIVPIWLGVTHQAMAFLIFAAMLYFVYHMFHKTKNKSYYH